MALEDKGRAAGVRDILRRLRGAAPRPLQPEDQIEQVMESPEEDEEASESGVPRKKAALPSRPRTPL